MAGVAEVVPLQALSLMAEMVAQVVEAEEPFLPLHLMLVMGVLAAAAAVLVEQTIAHLMLVMGGHSVAVVELVVHLYQ